MDDKKPLKDWTLNELKNHCKANIGKCSFDAVCPFKMICFNIEKDKYRLVEAHYPLNWNFDNTKLVCPESPPEVKERCECRHKRGGLK